MPCWRCCVAEELRSGDFDRLFDGWKKRQDTIDERKANSLPGKPYHEADIQVSKPYSRRQGDASLYLG